MELGFVTPSVSGGGLLWVEMGMCWGVGWLVGGS